MVQKTYLDAQTLLEDSFRLGAKVLNDGFKPSYIIAIWRGGTPIGVAVQEFMAYYGVQSDHIAIRTSSYSDGIDGRSKTVLIHGMDYLIKNITADDQLLIVDDVYDTGLTIQAVIAELKRKCRLNTPHDIRIAVPYFKPSRNKTGVDPEYYLHETEEWLKYPHSLEGLGVDEIKEHRPELFEIIGHLIPEQH
ncbi:hypoxanthine phosphoribosyltransferase [Amphritea balenae]|uniref:Hypoxanthine phosphoribosyltransferase n=2 Tax=Amphritea balenae TaxID=452629 RepID=A0A3P1SXF2_9GAMM|nr:phosphoribosyltransferase family protein [Amphritea balenae]RRD01655.1 hypoxanthine phosphoribosyltransferase [Amphritea balenae]GGK55269.1 hypoxanthine phosphoribosyltransferase [Amphritea balenae]